jgi:hypothetical protein
MAAFLCLTGWTWVHLYWQGPYGVLLWQDSTFGLAERFGITWDEFVGTGAADGIVQVWLGRIGWLYLAAALLALTVRKGRRWQQTGLIGSSVLLVVLAYAQFLGAQRQWPMFVEHGSQVLCPLLLVLAISLGVRHRVTIAVAVLGFIMTFAGHGCYAIGWLPTPGNFYAMTSVILGVEFGTAKLFLRTAGVLDFVICLAVFVPILRRPAVLYGAMWGFLTALARPVAGMSMSLNYWGADQYLHEAILRAPHFLVPLYLFLVWRRPDEEEEATRASKVIEETPTPSVTAMGS